MEPELIFKGKAIKEPKPVLVYEFAGKTNIKTLEGPAYNIDGQECFIIKNPETKEKGPIQKDIFEKTYKGDK